MIDNSYDIIVSDGDVLRADGKFGRTDVGIREGRVVAMASHITERRRAKHTIRATGLLVVPGLVDLHCHFFYGTIKSSLEPDPTFLPFGVTTAADGGTSGCYTYRGLRHHVIDRSRMRLRAFLNLSATGFASLPAVGELADQRLARVEEAIEVAAADPEHVRGIKIRFSRSALDGNDPSKMLGRALSLAERAGLPLMVHIADAALPLANVLDILRPGDIVTHLYHGDRNGILGDQGKVLPAVFRAAEKGVVLDVGHGGHHFDIDVAKASLSQGLFPTTLSTDAWAKYSSPGAAGYQLYSLPDVVCLLVALGVQLEDALGAVTSTPARVLGLGSEVGALSEGAVADIAIYEKVPGRYRYCDATGHTIDGKFALKPVYTILGGAVVQLGGLVSPSPFAETAVFGEGGGR